MSICNWGLHINLISNCQEFVSTSIASFFLWQVSEDHNTLEEQITLKVLPDCVTFTNILEYCGALDNLGAEQNIKSYFGPQRWQIKT